MTTKLELAPDVLAQSAALIIARVTGETTRAIVKIETGVMTHKYLVSAQGNEQFVVRFYPRARSFVVEYEPDIVRRCRAHGVRVPEVIADSRSGPSAGLAYMAYRMIPGTTLQERIEKGVQTEFGLVCPEIVAQLQLLGEIRMEGYGDVLNGTRAASPTWIEFMQKSFAAGLSAAIARHLLTPAHVDAITVIRKCLDVFAAPESARLAWGDFSPENVIVDQRGQLAGFVDFEGVVAADFDLSLGYLRARYAASHFYSAMVRHWPSRCPGEPRTALYALVRALRLLPHSGEPLPVGCEREPIEVFLPDIGSAVDEVLAWVRRRQPSVGG
jgi:aminoglycoside phosphotransferase (APT) family kinase protein